jgi:hypothetical protein
MSTEHVAAYANAAYWLQGENVEALDVTTIPNQHLHLEWRTQCARRTSQPRLEYNTDRLTRWG